MQGPEQRSTARRAVRKSAQTTYAGSLRGDLSAIATKLHQALHRSDITVWANADSEVHFDAPEKSPLISAEWLAGTYGVGASASDIEADLLLLQRECIPAAIMD